MKQYSSPEDVYKELVDDPEAGWLQGIVAFAIVEEHKIRWLRHYRQHNGKQPEPADVVDWYKQQPPSVISGAKIDAETALRAYHEGAVNRALAEEGKIVAEVMIVSEIRKLCGFMPQFWASFAAGFAASMLFAIMLAMVAFVALQDASPVDVGVKLRGVLEETKDGQDSGKP